MAKRNIELALCAVLFVGVAGAGLAQGGAADTIAKRQAIMKGFGGGVAGIKSAATGGDFDTASTKAKALAASVKGLDGMFPAGSGPDSGAATRAKAEVWSDKAGFQAALTKASTAADGIVAAADAKNADQVAAAITAFQATCGGCHTPYRGPAAA